MKRESYKASTIMVSEPNKEIATIRELQTDFYKNLDTEIVNNSFTKQVREHIKVITIVNLIFIRGIQR